MSDADRHPDTPSDVDDGRLDLAESAAIVPEWADVLDD
jgi:hypothetical protein